MDGAGAVGARDRRRATGGERGAAAEAGARRRGEYGGHLCRRGGAQPAHLCGGGGRDVNEPSEPSEQQLLEALRQIKTEDVVVQTVATLVNLAGQKLSVEGAKDPAEAQKAIDAARQMLSLVPDEAKPPIQNALDQIQMLFVKESQGGAPPPPEEPKIWTPGS